MEWQRRLFLDPDPRHTDAMPHQTADWTAPDLAAFEALAADALAAIPEPFQAAARELAILVEDFPADDMLREMGIENPFELTGLYDGVPLSEKSITEQNTRPDAIWLFRRPILNEWAARGNQPLGALVAHVLVHELAHHLGWSDDDIASIDRWWE